MRAQTGFTLTELILIMVLIGILAAFAAPRLNIEGFERQHFARELVIALRHAQRAAIASGCPVDVLIQGNGFSVAWAPGGDCGSGALPHPSRSGAFAGSGTISSGTGTVRFDGLGRTTVASTIVVADGPTVTVEAGSGYVRG